MECTIITQNGRSELMYGRQELTGVQNPKFYDVPESLIDEIRTCPTDVIQDVLSKIKDLCPEIM